jgi:membrane protein DedA with SNARE-associated domain
VDVASAGLVALFGLFIVKESGVPLPVPGDLVVIGTGVAAARGDVDPLTALAFIVVASIIGGTIQYALLRSVARPVLLRLLARVTSAERLDRQTERLRRGGARSVALARSTPGIRIVAIPASALAAIPPVAFVAGLSAGNALFIAAHFGLGYVLGESIVEAVHAALGPIAVTAVVLAVIGGVGWLVLARRRARTTGTPTSALATESAWADACCPACLSVAALRMQA